MDHGVPGRLNAVANGFEKAERIPCGPSHFFGFIPSGARLLPSAVTSSRMIVLVANRHSVIISRPHSIGERLKTLTEDVSFTRVPLHFESIA